MIAAPQCWTDSGAVNTAIQDDYAVVNQGQLKNLASEALEHLEAEASGTADLTAIQNLVDDWSVNPGNNDYAAVNAGQLKAVVAPFYDVLEDIGYHTEQGWQYTYPWDDPLTGSADDYALVNVGQVKQLFDFDLTGFVPPPPSIPPTILIDAPSDGQAYYETKSFDVMWTASDPDNDLEAVEIRLDGVLIHMDSGPAGSLSQSLEGLGTYTYMATAIDQALNTADASIDVVIDFVDSSDSDGMDDRWESDYGLNPSVDDSGDDPDMDGLTNLQEWEYKTDPNNPDSDGDGKEDGEEVGQGNDPNDPEDHPEPVFTLVSQLKMAEAYRYIEDGGEPCCGCDPYDYVEATIEGGSSWGGELDLLDPSEQRTVGQFIDEVAQEFEKPIYWSAEVEYEIEEETDWEYLLEASSRRDDDDPDIPLEAVWERIGLKSDIEIEEGRVLSFIGVVTTGSGTAQVVEQVQSVTMTFAPGSDEAEVSVSPDDEPDLPFKVDATDPRKLLVQPKIENGISREAQLLPVEFKKIYEENNPVNHVHDTTPKDDPPPLPRNILYTVIVPQSLDYHLKLEMEIPEEFRTKFIWAVVNDQDQVAAQQFFPQTGPADVVFEHNASEWRADYDVFVGYDANDNAQLDESEKIQVNVPKLNQPLRIHGANSQAYAESNIAIATGGILGGVVAPLAEALLDIFFFADASQVDPDWQPTSTTTDSSFNCFSGEWSDWLTHNAGASFNTDGDATIKVYTWDSATAASNKLASAPGITDNVLAMYGLKQLNIQTALQDSEIGAEMSFPSDTGWYDIPLDRVTFEEDLLHIDEFLAVARARISGFKVRFKAKKTSSGIDIIKTTSTGVIEDLYDFNYVAGFLSQRAATVQLSHGNGSFGSSREAGQIFRNRFEFHKTWNGLP